jgi:hypothetical protein
MVSGAAFSMLLVLFSMCSTFKMYCSSPSLNIFDVKAGKQIRNVRVTFLM